MLTESVAFQKSLSDYYVYFSGKGVPMDRLLLNLSGLKPGTGHWDAVEIARTIIFTTLTVLIGGFVGEGARRIRKAESAGAKVAYPIIGAIAVGAPMANQLVKWANED